jgi:hypothetical protein
MEDLELAQRHLESLKALFVRHSGEADARALRCLVSLCKAVSLSLEDEYCRDKLAAIEDQGAELFTASAPTCCASASSTRSSCSKAVSTRSRT